MIGNEVECEQLVWVPKEAGQSVTFNTYVWRRGTVPIWWHAELKLDATQADIYVSDQDPYKGSPQYFQRLSNRYVARTVGVNQSKNASVPVFCVNLVRNGQWESESILVQHFDRCINYITSTGELPSTQIQLINFDWAASTEARGGQHLFRGILNLLQVSPVSTEERRTIHELWKLLKEPTMSVGISEGDYLPSQQRTRDCCGEVIYNNDIEGAFCLRSHQNGAIRYNCADSVDGTNTASYFGALQVLVEQCRRLGISLDRNGTCPCPAWKRFDEKVDEFKKSTILSPVSQLADLFQLAGDIHSLLYTGTEAMPSQMLSIFNEEAEYGEAEDMIARSLTRGKQVISRRATHVVRGLKAFVDSSRQRQLEMFLGRRLFKHLPSIPVQPLSVLSRPSGFFLKPIANIFPNHVGGASLLSFNKKDVIWVCPQATDAVELLVYLAEPGHVCQLLLTISHGKDNSTYPSKVDVSTGQDLNSLIPVLEGATIPTCAKGTNLLIPLPGPISAEDMTITGAGARHHSQNASTLSVLYDFEEVEGELDFLTRVVKLTFYPALSDQSPVALGEIGILGASLPWSGAFTGDGSGAKLIELSKKFQKDNLLTGRVTSNGSQQYISHLKNLAGADLRKKLDFTEAMKLEIERLRLNLSAAERDRALWSVGIDPASINPNLLLEESYMKRLCRIAHSLALLRQASLEDRITAAIGLENTDNDIIDFWNIAGLGEKCLGVMCEAEVPATPFSTVPPTSVQLPLVCSRCKRKVCKVCCAGKGALLLVSYGIVQSQGGSSPGGQVDVSTIGMTAIDGIICKSCCQGIELDALMLDYIRVLTSLRRSTRAGDAAHTALDQVMGSSLRDFPSERKRHSDPKTAVEVQRQLLKGEESLAEFPFASFLYPVPTAVGSAPPLSLLAPLAFGSEHSYWKAPTSDSSVELVIALGTLSDVSGVIMLVSPCGYSAADVPSIINIIFLRILWTRNLAAEDGVPRHIRFTFGNPVRCRILWITLSLQHPGSYSVNLEKDLNLFSLEKNLISQLDWRASSAGSTEREPCINAKRILVVGSMVKKETRVPRSLIRPTNCRPVTQGSDQTNSRNWLDRDPQLQRFKVTFQAARLKDNGLTLEQDLSSLSPLIAGFRLDAFSAFKPRITHSPLPDAYTQDGLTLMDDRYISPAVLYIQVTALEESQKEVTVGKYRLPEAKPDTAMYFDFPRKIDARRVTFRLLGDVAAFVDDPAKQQDSNSMTAQLATGLSLWNRVNLYHYMALGDHLAV
ncbi:hypothetical protein ACJRO7_000192 [Eucalyptus globulus]|uniref:SAC domain-containing protein n=1 Tax=Eucalyptus globulus TaxID=34317 RepID=A0ABD3LR12_EUCGL